jgi:hypothetical protein
MLGGGRETGDCTANNNKEMVFSAQSAEQQLDTTEEWGFLNGVLSNNWIQHRKWRFLRDPLGNN